MTAISFLFILGSLSFIVGTATHQPIGWWAGGTFLTAASFLLVAAAPGDWRAWAFLWGSLAFTAGASGYAAEWLVRG